MVPSYRASLVLPPNERECFFVGLLLLAQFCVDVVGAVVVAKKV
jgi:hypothetical protein